MEAGWKRQWSLLFGLFWVVVEFLLLIECSLKSPNYFRNIDNKELRSYPPVCLQVLDQQVILGNGLVNVTLSTPNGTVTGIQYNGVDNLLEINNKENNRGYWDFVWGDSGHPKGIYDLLYGRNYTVIKQNENQVELSFTRTWNPSMGDNVIPLNIDKRFIMLRGCPGFYAYGIFERLKEWPDITIYQGRIVFKLRQELFQYMAISDKRQRIMPTAQDRQTGQVLDYPEAVLLTNTTNPALKGQVDDKYQYSCEDKDNRVHGWISPNPLVGFWMITPTDEFRTGGPIKQDLTSHVGPTTISMFFSTHYAGESLGIQFRNGEAWKKVFGPVLVYLNSGQANSNIQTLWEDAKTKMLTETKKWPYDFPCSEDFSHADQRGTVSGHLKVCDRFIKKDPMTAKSAYVGLAPLGEVGSWQRENKGYQFWTQADNQGHFLIKNVRPGNYNLYGWVPGIVGDYKYNVNLSITPGTKLKLGVLVYNPPRNGPTLWQIGVPDRTAAEFYVPDPSPTLMNQLYNEKLDKFRQYGLWDRYAELYPTQDLVYKVGVSNYQKDWFFAHVNRNIGNKTYQPTTWQVLFDLKNVARTGNYTLQVALASAHEAELQIWINDEHKAQPNFTTGLIGKDNAIARHGIHGLYWFYSVGISCSQLVMGTNIIYLTQSRGQGPFRGIMYDYIRLEGPPRTT